jgi:hypothetical protein
MILTLVLLSKKKIDLQIEDKDQVTTPQMLDTMMSNFHRSGYVKISPTELILTSAIERIEARDEEKNDKH